MIRVPRPGNWKLAPGGQLNYCANCISFRCQKPGKSSKVFFLSKRFAPPEVSLDFCINKALAKTKMKSGELVETLLRL